MVVGGVRAPHGIADGRPDAVPRRDVNPPRRPPSDA